MGRVEVVIRPGPDRSWPSRRQIKNQMRRRTNIWDERQRKVLYVLYMDNMYDIQMRANIFNAIFKSHQENIGIAQMPAATLTSQFYMSRSDRASAQRSWKNIIDAFQSDDLNATRTQIRLFAARIETLQSTSSRHALDADEWQISEGTGDNLALNSPIRRVKCGAIRRPVQIERSWYADPPSRSTYASKKCKKRSIKQKKGVEAIKPPKLPFEQLNGTIIYRTAAVQAQIEQAELIPVEKDRAQPQMQGLLFRFWDVNDSQGWNSVSGFCCGRNENNNFTTVPPGPPLLCWDDLFNHVNNAKKSSPFISTSDNLRWTLRHAQRRAERSGTIDTLQITVFDVNRISPGTIFWAKPHIVELRKVKPFDPDKMHYHGTHEYLIWNRIPSTAVLYTIKLKTLIAIINASSELKDFFALQDLFAPGEMLKFERLQSRRQRVLDLRAIDSIAQAYAMFGFTSQAPYKHISHFVLEMLQGWQIGIRPLAPEQWATMSTAFVNRLLHHTIDLQKHSIEAYPRTERVEKIKATFLYAVRAAIAREWNMFAERTPEKLEKMIRKASRCYVQDPVDIICNALENAHLAVKEAGVLEERRWAKPSTSAHLTQRITLPQLSITNDGSTAQNARLIDESSDEEVIAVNSSFLDQGVKAEGASHHNQMYAGSHAVDEREHYMTPPNSGGSRPSRRLFTETAQIDIPQTGPQQLPTP